MRLHTIAAVAFVLVVACARASASPQIEPKESIPEYLRKYNISVEQHWATTEDGYILALFRMPRPGAPVLLLQHGILCSAWHWIVNSPSIAPGIQLYNEGYDVWMTNTRGNTYSRNHTTLDPKYNKAFWNFTFAEMGRYDVPANIEYILNNTGKPSLSYLGWSQGTSQFFVSMTDSKLKSYVEQKVNLFVAFAPVTWMKHQSSLLLSAATEFRLDLVYDTLFPYGFLGFGNQIANAFCKLTLGAICKITVDVICGHSSLDTAAAITNLTAHFPAGTSAKELVHYSQLIRSNHFGEFDYGLEGNIKQYGQKTPPPYDMAKIGVPTALFAGEKDDLGDVKDVANLVEHIGENNPALVYNKTFSDFSHITYFTGTAGAFQQWYPDLKQLLKKYNPVPN